jgi:hypothetical protein
MILGLLGAANAKDPKLKAVRTCVSVELIFMKLIRCLCEG